MGQLPTTEVPEDVLAERSEYDTQRKLLPLPSVDLEYSAATTPSIQFSEANEETKEGQESICADRIEVAAFR